MICSRIRAARPLYPRQRLGAERGRALRMNRVGLWNAIETRKALLICVANQRFTTLGGGPPPGGNTRRRWLLVPSSVLSPRFASKVTRPGLCIHVSASALSEAARLTRGSGSLLRRGKRLLNCVAN